MMTIEWVIEHAISGVLRLDLTRGSMRDQSGDEGIHAALICSFWDEEGAGIACVEWFASEASSPYISSFKCCIKKEGRMTFIGDIIADWDPHWRVESERLCRLGLNRVKFGDKPNWAWHHLTPANLLIRDNLALLEGAVSQYRHSTPGTNVDITSTLIQAAKFLHTLRSTSHRELVSLTAWS